MEPSGNEKEGLFGNLGGQEDVGAPLEMESLCMACGANGITKILLTRIPHFREIILMAFECTTCGARNNEVQSGAPVQEQGVLVSVSIQTSRDLSRQVVKAETAAVTLVELALEIPAATQRGVLTTIEGLLSGALDGLSMEQEYRKENHTELYTQIEGILAKLRGYLEGNESFTLTLDDPAGNSYIENLCAPRSDPQMTVKHYKRSKEQDIALGLIDADDDSSEKKPNGDVIGESGLTTDDLAYKEEVHTFPGNCSRCNAPSDTKMHMLGNFVIHFLVRFGIQRTEIPHFKDVIIMATTCDVCGYKSNEVKSGGAISEKGRRITLKMEEAEDLSRDILKSETCGLKIPEIDLELTPGTLGGRFTTVEGLLSQVHDELSERAPFVGGDSATQESKTGLQLFLQKLKKVLGVEVKPVTLILDDPLANSYLQNLYAPDPDPNMTTEDYERTWEQNEAYGLNDIDLEPATMPEELQEAQNEQKFPENFKG